MTRSPAASPDIAIIACHTRRRFLREAVKSVLGQACHATEVILQNDCSSQLGRRKLWNSRSTSDKLICKTPAPASLWKASLLFAGRLAAFGRASCRARSREISPTSNNSSNIQRRHTRLPLPDIWLQGNGNSHRTFAQRVSYSLLITISYTGLWLEKLNLV